MTWPLRIFTVVFIAFTLIILYLLIKPPPLAVNPQQNTITQVPRTDGLIHFVALDSRYIPVSISTVKNGDAGILLLKIKNKPIVTNESYALFHKLSALADFDLNQDAKITADDEIYNNLYIAHINKHKKQLLIFPLAKSGITALEFNAKNLSQEIAGDPAHFTSSVGKVIRTDGSRGEMYIVDMEADYISSLVIKPSINKVQPQLASD